jgi:plastocyanin
MKRKALSMLSLVTLMGLALTASWAMAASGLLADATVSFGQWQTEADPPLDRLAANPAGGVGNNHELIPNVVWIKAGGAVNFVISGLHNVAVYDHGIQPSDINLDQPLPGVAGGIIDDPEKRLYRGWDPNTIPNTYQRDRVETLQFAQPGTYLVICGVVNHFRDDKMYGFVKVLPAPKKED